MPPVIAFKRKALTEYHCKVVLSLGAMVLALIRVVLEGMLLK